MKWSYVWTAELTAKKHTAGWAGQGAHVPNTFIYHWKQTPTGNSENGNRNQNSELTFSRKQACSKNFPIVCPLFHVWVPLASENFPLLFAFLISPGKKAFISVMLIRNILLFGV